MVQDLRRGGSKSPPPRIWEPLKSLGEIGLDKEPFSFDIISIENTLMRRDFLCRFFVQILLAWLKYRPYRLDLSFSVPRRGTKGIWNTIYTTLQSWIKKMICGGIQMSRISWLTLHLKLLSPYKSSIQSEMGFSGRKACYYFAGCQIRYVCKLSF